MKQETRIIKDFLKSVDIDKHIKVHAAPDTTAILEKGLIKFNKDFYSSPFHKKLGRIVYRTLKNTGLNFGKIHYMTFSILHELGHIIMIKTYADADLEHDLYSQQVIDILQAAKEDEKKGCRFWRIQKNIIDKYRRLKLEADADKKAYELYKDFPKEVKKLDELMVKFIKEDKKRHRKIKKGSK